MNDRIKTWLADWIAAGNPRRIARTLVQVFGGVVIAFLLDWGADGVVAPREYIFGDGGVIVVGTTFLALLMNRSSS